VRNSNQDPDPSSSQYPSAPRTEINANLRWAVATELGLAVVAIALGWLFGVTPWQPLASGPLAEHGPRDLLIGLLAALPMVAVFAAIQAWPLVALRELDRQIRTLLAGLFRGARWWQLGILCLAAGISEELLFRGFLQAALRQALEDWPAGSLAALVLASLVFGAVHSLSWTYAILASAVGLYLGWIYLQFHSLVVPMTAHAVYDFVAILYLLRAEPRR
jgi:membrane protease YdiL (CAAX protease family)